MSLGQRLRIALAATLLAGAALPSAQAQATVPLYLLATGVPSSTLSNTAASATTLANYDSGRDTYAGLLIAMGGSGAGETDATKYQRWLSGTSGVVYSGPLQLDLWSAIQKFKTGKQGEVFAYLRDCNSSGASCTTLYTATLNVADWSGGSSTWVQKTISFGAVTLSVASGRTLELKVVVGNNSQDDMWFAYATTTYSSVLAAPAAAGPDHYELSLPSSSLACLAGTVTVTACANSSSPCTSVATTLNGQTATLATGAGTLGSTTVTFNASGVASTTLSHSAAADGASVAITLSGEQTSAINARRCCPDGASCAAGNSCSTTFNTAALIVAAAANGAATTVPAQTAGTASAGYFLRAVKTSTTTQACEAAITGVGNVNWSITCNNPTTCSAGNLMTVTGNSALAVAGNANGSTASSTAVPMTFDANGNAPFSFNYADVGRVTLNASRAAGGSLLTALTGASNAFVVKPGGFVLSTIRQTAAPQGVNPAAADANGAKFVKAGESFSATVTARTSGGATTPNYGRETSPEGVLLTHALVLPAGGASGTLSNGSIAGGSFTAGVATVTTLALSEVGIITLSPAVADGDYLGAGNIIGTASGPVGRFIPATLSVGTASVGHRDGQACAPASAFSYLGENFRLAFTLSALNASGAVTQNYSGSFARFDPASGNWNLAGVSGSSAFSAASGRLSLGAASGSFTSGVAVNAALVAAALRASNPDGPFNARFGVAPVDSDGVGLAAFDMASSPGGGNDRLGIASVALHFGRLRVSNALGAADRALALPVTAQQWNGSAFATQTLDSCTRIAASAVNMGNLGGTLTAADTSVAAGISLSAGEGSLRLAAPGAGRSGTLDVALSLGAGATDTSCLQSWAPASGDAASAGANLTFLRGAWCASTFGQDPSARATFGRQRGGLNTIHRREHY